MARYTRPIRERLWLLKYNRNRILIGFLLPMDDIFSNSTESLYPKLIPVLDFTTHRLASILWLLEKKIIARGPWTKSGRGAMTQHLGEIRDSSQPVCSMQAKAIYSLSMVSGTQGMWSPASTEAGAGTKAILPSLSLLPTVYMETLLAFPGTSTLGKIVNQF